MLMINILIFFASGRIPTAIVVKNFLGNSRGILIIGGDVYDNGNWKGSNAIQFLKINSSATPDQYELKQLNYW